jgi:hypothetical protein
VAPVLPVTPATEKTERDAVTTSTVEPAELRFLRRTSTVSPELRTTTPKKEMDWTVEAKNWP